MIKNILRLTIKALKFLLLNTLWLILWLFGLGTSLIYLLRLEVGDRWFPIRLISYSMPWMLLILIPPLIIALIGRKRWLATVLAIPILYTLLTYAPLFLPRSSFVLADNAPFKIMSYNVLSGNENTTAIATVIKQTQPDIILLQEVRPPRNQPLFEALANLYEGDEVYIAYAPSIEQAVVSRYPLTEREIYPNKGRAQQVLVDLPTGSITLWNVHPKSQIGWRRRHFQIKELLNEIRPIEEPTILAGDFNTTDQTDTYKLIDRYFDNAHWQAGWGFGFTFPTPGRFHLKGDVPVPSLVRIDHIFSSDHFFVHQAETLETAGGSDHLPVVATLSRIR